MIYALSTISLIQTMLIVYLFVLINRKPATVLESKSNGSSNGEILTKEKLSAIRKNIQELRFDVYQLQNPPKYRIGDKLDGGIVYEIEFRNNNMAGASWLYKIVKGKQLSQVYDKDTFYSFSIAEMW